MVSAAVFGVFRTLEATEIILFIGNFAGSSGTVKLGGHVGILTALVAWYASAAGVIKRHAWRPAPVGRQAVRRRSRAGCPTKGPQVIPGARAAPGITCLSG